MFRKKATPWVMAMTMIGMMGVSGAQTLEEQYLNQLSPYKRRVGERQINNIVTGKNPVYKFDHLYQASDDVKSIYATGAKNAGAPHVEDIYTPPSDPVQHCRDAVAWSYADNNYDKLTQSIDAASKQFKEETGDTLYQFSYGFATTYLSAICSKE